MQTGIVLALVICAMPLLASLVISALGKNAGKWCDKVGIGAMFVSLAASVWLTLGHHEFIGQKWDFEWITVAGHPWRIGILLDGMTFALLIVVTLVSFLVHLFSRQYMHGDERFADFFRWIGFFTFSMLVLVISDNLLTLFVAWELMGLSSYKLIGHYFKKESAYLACKKAFMTTRVGDVGFFLALLALYLHTGSLQYSEIFEKAHAGVIPAVTITWISLGLFMGSMGKSAQFPLHIWLPDAMEGPTPVSALIHAATMVAAGVYLIGRMMSLICLSPVALVVIACIGAFTAIFAAAIAFTATDIKKVLAYSTISQLGFMFTALGVGSNIAWQAGMFHLVTHAFFKACLFLGSGSVIHACHHEQDMTRMGGLRKKLPLTHLTYLLACLSIAGFGIPMLPIGFAGFFSKDQILMGLWQGNGGANDDVYKTLCIVLTLTATMTSFYMFRSYWLTFWTKPRDQKIHDHAHESPWEMTTALLVLGGLAVVAGYGWANIFLPAGGEHGSLIEGLKEWEHEDVHHAHIMASIFAGFACFAGIGLSAWCYLTASGERARKAARAAISPIYNAAKRKFFMDELAETLVIRPTVVLGALLAWTDRDVVDGVVDSVGSSAVATGELSAKADDSVVDGAVHAAADVAWGGGWLFSRAQTGRLRNYFFGAVGTVALFAVIVLYLTRS
ncbi:MAG: NADH-quinone oxidoreductase subunit L [Planctomycetes bacterium]|nr:NADH-quinone oxidoreductase subunit L [Planctomycetota bacterium]